MIGILAIDSSHWSHGPSPKMTPIKVTNAGRYAVVTIDGQTFQLSEQDSRHLRSEINRCLQAWAERRKRHGKS